MPYPDTSIVIDVPYPDPRGDHRVPRGGLRGDVRGAELLWRDDYGAESDGFDAAFEDPWGRHVRPVGHWRRRSAAPEGWTDE